MTSPERVLREKVQKVAALAKSTSEAAKVSRETIAAQRVEPVELDRGVSDGGSSGPASLP